MSFVDRKVHIVEVVFWSLMVGFGEAYIGAYALACGFSESFAGLIAALPLAIASILQLFSQQLLKWIKKRRYFVVICATAQALTLWLVAGHGLFDRESQWLLIFVLTLYWFFGLSLGPVWNAWVVSLLQPGEQNRFFSRRGPFHEGSVLLGLVMAGSILSAMQEELLAFVLLFLGAGIFRLVSAYSLYLTPDEPESGAIQPANVFEVSSLTKWLVSKRVLKVLTLLALFNFGVYLGAPFFTPLMLRQLNLDYETYMFLIAVPFVSRALSYPVFEVIVRSIGLTKIILATMLVIAAVPVAWAHFPKLHFIVLFQVFAGIAWAGFEYGIVLRQIADFSQLERSRVLVWNNFFVGLFTIAGVSVGAQILGSNPTFSDYKLLFEVSTVFRLVPIVLVFFIDWSIPERLIQRVYLRLVSVRPGRGGGASKPVLYTDD